MIKRFRNSSFYRMLLSLAAFFAIFFILFSAISVSKQTTYVTNIVDLYDDIVADIFTIDFDADPAVVSEHGQKVLDMYRRACTYTITNIRVYYLIDEAQGLYDCYDINADSVTFYENRSCEELDKQQREVLLNQKKDQFRMEGSNLIYSSCYKAEGSGLSKMVEVTLPESRLLNNLKETVLPLAFGCLLLLAFAFFLLSFMFRNRVMKPLQEFGSYLKEVSSDPLAASGPGYQKKVEAYQQGLSRISPEISESIFTINTLIRQNAASQAELDIAKKIQTGLLPPFDLETEGYSIHAYLNMVSRVGGDLFEYFDLDADHLCLAIGDVSGHGIVAAMFMSSVVSSLRYHAERYEDPAKILGAVNNDMMQWNPEHLFLTAFLAIYDKTSGRLTYACAGHNPPYLLDDSLRKLDNVQGVVMGVFEDEEYENSTVALKPGSQLVMYTDGLTESYTKEGIFFGEERLEEVLKEQCGRAADTRQVILDHLQAFMGENESRDDVTLLVFRIMDAGNHKV